MSANSAPRHLLLAASAAALLLTGTQTNGLIGKAHAAADLDTFIMASLQNSGQASAGAAKENPPAKAKADKSRAAKKQAANSSIKEPIQATAAPVKPTPRPSSGGLLAAIGVIGNATPIASDDKPERAIEAKRDRAASQSGPAVFYTSGYGQGPQMPPVRMMQDAAQTPASAARPLPVTAPSATRVGAPKKPESRVETPAAKPIVSATPAPLPRATVSPVPNRGGLLAALGIGADTPPAPAAEAKADKPATTATVGLPAASKPPEPAKSDVVHTGSINRPVGHALKEAAPPRIPGTNAAPVSAIDPVKPGAAKNFAGDPNEPTPRVVVAAVSAAPSVQSPPVQAALVPAPVERPVVQRPASNAGGLLAAIGIRTRAEPGPMQANAQVPIAYRGPAVVNAEAAYARGEMALAARSLDYRVDAGDKLRVVVFGQEGLTNTYAIDAGGGITMPLIGRVAARGQTPGALAAHITERLRKGYIRDPSVAVEIESYRPFYILGEVAAPGQYPYVPNMSVEAAVAIAGGFSPRARRDSVILTQKVDGGQLRGAVPLGTPLSPGDTITVGERWF